MAEYLMGDADQKRETLIERTGMRHYVFNILGKAAHRPASGWRLVWLDDVEVVEDVEAKLADHVLSRAQEKGLPRAVFGGNGEKHCL
jgi:hypothetical protein